MACGAQSVHLQQPGRAMGTTIELSIDGTIDVTSLWPSGHSDADTTTLHISVGNKAVQLENPLGSGQRQPVDIYRQAYQRGAKRPDGAFEHKPVVDAQNRIAVRLQRVDAPELHITPGQVKGSSLAGLGWFQKFRQRQAETATAKLRTHLLRMAPNNQRLPCTFVSRLDKSKGPADAVDMYGRFVGDVLVGPRQENLNLWLLEQGWAIVALYTSMQADEIDQTLAAWAQGAGRGIRRHYRQAFEPFEFLVFREPGAQTQAERDSQAFIHPKYFRRYVTWWAHHHAGGYAGSFADYLEQRAEKVYRLSEFRAWLDAGGAKPPRYPLYDRNTDGDQVSWPPEDFIFEETASKLYADINGRPTQLSHVHWGP
jgi:endonuclease YncB( thermonuclease family)